MSDNVDGLDLEDAKGKQEDPENGTLLDKTDAHPFYSGLGRSHAEYSVAQLTVEQSSTEYSMKSDLRGRCVIFNHRHFEPRSKLSEREGTEKDAESLKDCFNRLKFDVEQIEDATAIEVKAKLKGLCLEVSNEDECLVICVLTHGQQGYLWARDQPYAVDELYQHFTEDKCAPLAGKPKLFFVQACRGNSFDKGAVVRGFVDQIDGPEACYKIPVWPDFMIVYSTIPGYYSWRERDKGSWFIQALTVIFNEYADSMDLLSMLTLVNREVAYGHESRSNEEGFDGNKQVPCVTSMLTRKIYFTPRSHKDKSTVINDDDQ